MPNLNLDAHVGRVLMSFDLHAVCSPLFRVITDPTNPDGKPIDARMAKAMADEMTRKLHRAVKDTLAPGDTLEWSLDPPKFAPLGQPGVIMPKAERDAKFKAMTDSIASSWQAGDEARAAQQAADPHNGQPGWWKVEGIRHAAIVRASSAPEAIEKAAGSGKVQSWECADAEWIGEELPDVVEV